MSNQQNNIPLTSKTINSRINTHTNNWRFGESSTTLKETNTARLNALKDHGFIGDSRRWQQSDLIKASEFNTIFLAIKEEIKNLTDNF